MTSNLAEIRKERRLTTAALSERLSGLGRPILANGITKIEKGARRVDTDDLIALALALDVTPNRLLLPAAADDEQVELAPSLRVTSAEAWRWATGERPLGHEDEEDEGEEVDRFRRENRPHDQPRDENFIPYLKRNAALFAALRQAVFAAQAAGVPTEAIKSYVGAFDDIYLDASADDERDPARVRLSEDPAEAAKQLADERMQDDKIRAELANPTGRPLRDVLRGSEQPDDGEGTDS